MEKKQNILPTFIFFFILSLLVFLLSAGNLFGLGLIGNALFPVEGAIYKLSRTPFSFSKTSEVDLLRQQNQDLQQKLAHLQELQDDNKALRDQFATAIPSPRSLIPAHIIGMPSLIPGINAPEELILDKGSQDGVALGQAVVYKDNLVGVIEKVANHASQVLLVTNKSSSFTAQTSQTNALGVVKGLGNGEMILDNVVLADSLQVGDTILTKGDKTLGGKGLREGLIVGKITSVDKNPSAIFQKARIQSLVQVAALSDVFILTQ